MESTILITVVLDLVQTGGNYEQHYCSKGRKREYIFISCADYNRNAIL